LYKAKSATAVLQIWARSQFDAECCKNASTWNLAGANVAPIRKYHYNQSIAFALMGRLFDGPRSIMRSAMAALMRHGGRAESKP
jgi:hypothetical protein